MNNQKTIFAIIAIVAALSVAAIVPAMMSTTIAKSEQFKDTGNPHDRPGNSDSEGDPHGPGNSPGSSGNPHFCPDDQCD
jgi:hypothetical protein